MNRILNALAFQSAWWALVAGVGWGLEWPALIYGTLLASLHLFVTARRLPEIQLAMLVMLMGIVMDSSLQFFSVILFKGSALFPLSPWWLWLLWFLFGMTLNSSMAFLKTQPWFLSAALGALFGPINYIAGAKLGAAEVVQNMSNIAVLALSWMLALPLMVRAANIICPSPAAPSAVTH